ASTDTAASAARATARYDDPDSRRRDAGLPGHVAFADVTAGDVLATTGMASAWRSGGVDPPPRAGIGIAAGGVGGVDLASDGPHALIAGTTGAGKSELLRTLVAALAARSSPEHVTFLLVDYKGGSAFDACAALPHVVGVVTDLDEHLAARALRSLEAEIRR